MSYSQRILSENALTRGLYRRVAASDVGRRLTAGSLWSLVNTVLIKSATLVQSIVLARILGVSGFGEWGILLSTITTVGVFATFGLMSTVTKHVAQWRVAEPERLGRFVVLALGSAFSIGAVTSVVMVVAAGFIADHVLMTPQLRQAVMVVGLIVMLNVVTAILTAIVNGLERFRDASIINGICTVFGISLTIALAMNGLVLGAIIGLAVASLLTTVAFSFWVNTLLRRYNIPLSGKDALGEWKAIRDFALPSAIADITVMAAIWMSQLALVRQANGLEQMGAYQAANQWRTIVVFLPSQMIAAYLPVLASMIHVSPARLQAIQRKILAVTMLVAAALALPVALAAPWLMALYGKDFQEYWPILAVLCLIPIPDIGHVIFQNTAMVNGYAWTLVLSNLAMVAAVILGVWWLIPQHHGLGLALTLLLGYSSRVCVEYLFYRSRSARSAANA